MLLPGGNSIGQTTINWYLPANQAYTNCKRVKFGTPVIFK